MVTALARELGHRLDRARLRAIRLRREPRELTLYFRQATLQWNLHPDDGRVALGPASEPPADTRPLQAVLQGIDALPDERHLQLRLLKVRGRTALVRVVVELMTNQWNALVLEGEAGIIRHLLRSRRAGDRVLAGGAAYSPPEVSTREGREDLIQPERWQELMAGHRERGESGTLLGVLAFSSPLNLPALLGEHLTDATREERLEEGHRVWNTLRDPDPPAPCVLHTPEGPRPYPVPLPPFPITPKASFLDAVRGAAGTEDPREAPLQDLLERLDRAIRRSRDRIRALSRQLAEGEEPDELRERANLLLSRIQDVPRGAPSVSLPGFDGGVVQIQLDPALSAQENAAAIYREAARVERARDRLPDLITSAESEAAEMEDLRKGLVEGKVSPNEARSRLPEETTGGGAAQSEGERLPYYRFRSSGGLEIRVGRGARDNDELTFRHSHPEDVWAHARDAAGAHVVLRWRESGSPPGRDLAEAAILAALHSRSRTSKTAPVDWTRRKYVRKPRHAPPGTVVLSHAKTLFVEVDAGLPERLRWDR
jgi:predicted ribosome quality control (RQC) complex YloA/Tae2 family protein